MPPLTVRRYRPTDAERVRELHEVAMREAGAFVEGAPDPDLEAVRGTYLDTGGEFLVGELDDAVVAMGAFRPATGDETDVLELPDGTMTVTRMRVDPDHQRRGYGQRCYDALERRARERDVPALVLDTTPTQTAACRFYREQVRYEDASLELLYYRKSLDTGVDGET